MTKIHCVKSDDYEALYVNGKIYNEGNPLNEGNERVLYFINIANSYGININEIKFGYINLVEHTEYGEFPNDLDELLNYIKWEK